MRLPFILLSSLLLGAACGKTGSSVEPPRAANGVLDLREYDFTRDGPVRLAGDWEFYWKRFVPPAAFGGSAPPRPSGTVAVPGAWDNFLHEGRKIGADGYATYRLKVLLDDPVPIWALTTVDFYAAHEVFVNGVKVGGRGRVARDAESIEAVVTAALFEFPGGEDRTLDIVVYQSNFNHFRGYTEDIVLGPADFMREARERRIAFEVFVFGALVIMGIYHLFLFVLRTEDRSPLFFGSFCLLIALFTMLTGMRYVVHLFPGHGFYWTLIYIAMALGPAVFNSFLYSLFPHETNRTVWLILCWVGGLLVLFTLAVPARIFSSLLSVYVLVIALSGPYSIFVLIRAMLNRQEGALLFLPGFLVLFAGTMNDALYAHALVATGYYSGFALVIFIFFQAAMLSMRFARAFHTVTNLTSELAAKNRDLNRLDRLKNEFLANTSHELRTPLNGIIGIAEAMREGAAGELNDRAKHNLELIVYSGSRLAGLINDILDFQKLRNDDVRLNQRAVDLRQATDVVLAVSRPLLAGKELKLRNDLPLDLPSIYADENRLQQILHNLVGNAIKFTAEGTIAVSARLDGAMIEISVSDTGIGIPLERQADIFQSFKQIDASSEREFGGTGLGLSISKRLVEMHDGEIWVESDPGEGATFKFTLPAIYETPETSSGLNANLRLREVPLPVPPARSGEPVPVAGVDEESRERTILVVDDESLNRHVLANLLSVRKYNVLEAGDGVEALEILERVTPDAVLLDIMMPRMNGYEVCQKIRETYSPAELPVIFLSAKNEVEDLIAGLQSGGNDYLSKPFAAPELLARVQSQTNLKRVHAEALALREKLVDQEKLAAVGSMAAGIVHDFKTPVSIIKGYTELADDETVDRDSRSQFLQIVTREADHLADMAQDILEYTRGVFQLNLRQVPAAEFLETVRKSLVPYFAPKNIVYEVAAVFEGRLTIDPARFVRVLINIAGNAADVMPEGGVFETRLEPEGSGVLLSLKDSGPGIPPEIQDTLFEPFVTMGKDHGTGLGLAITKSIVEAHGGTIRFETGPGRGTTFFIRLPG